jgi:hypothetical protein
MDSIKVGNPRDKSLLLLKLKVEHKNFKKTKRPHFVTKLDTADGIFDALIKI